MPSVPDPEVLFSMDGMEEGGKPDPRLPRTKLNKAVPSTSVSWPTEIRPCEPSKLSDQTKRPPSLKYWLRAKGKLSNDQALHRCVGAYFSDLLFLQVSLNPHRGKGRKLISLSLDHSMWFHRDIKADDWLLFVVDSPTAYNARGFCSGQLFNRKGELVLSVVQVGVVRQVKTPPSATISKL